MTEEPFRWLEAVANRREYVAEQLKGGTPVFGASLADGIFLLGVGGGHSKVFELFDRQAIASLGHPADIERIRQTLIDAAHLEAFTRAPEDVSLRRLVAFGLGPQMKTNFEQLFSAPFLVESLLAELGKEPTRDLFFRLHFDGAFDIGQGGVHVAAASRDTETAARTWLAATINGATALPAAVDFCLQAWWMATTGAPFATPPGEDERRRGWRAATTGKTVEIGWLDRRSERLAAYRPWTLAEFGLA
jgi:proteasome alpha subunit